LEDLDAEEELNSAWEMRENIKISGKESGVFLIES
jgi:hypothetical protein